jgi:hypothetical protein
MLALPEMAQRYLTYCGRPSYATGLHARTGTRKLLQAAHEAYLQAGTQAGPGATGHAAHLARAYGLYSAAMGAALLKTTDVVLGTGLNPPLPKTIQNLTQLRAHLKDIARCPADTGLAGFITGYLAGFPMVVGALWGAGVAGLGVGARHATHALGLATPPSGPWRRSLSHGAQRGAQVAAQVQLLSLVNPALVALWATAVGAGRCVTGATKCVLAGTLFGLGYGLGYAVGEVEHQVYRRRCANTSV